MTGFIIASFFIFIGFANCFSPTKILVDPVSRLFVDEYQRIRIFHGVNAVYKISPWHPTVSGFDSENTLSAVDSENLNKWGFNIVRLGVMWPGVEPTTRGAYNQTYLDQIETIVTNLAKNDISVILDFHQDIWHRKFCGEGVPDYVFETCQGSEPSDTAAFPRPIVNSSYPSDKDGNPAIDACLEKNFAAYYLSAEVGAGFQCLYDNKDGLWDAFAGYWVAIATRFSKTANVLGYELLNEPWAGDVIAQPKNLSPGYTERAYLQPLYEHVHKAIRTVDDEKIIFFEGLTIDYFPNGFTAGPGGAAYNDRQALAYHIYCAQDPSPKVEKVCEEVDDAFLALRRNDASRMGVGMIMTEFGAIEDTSANIFALTKTLEMADKFQQSWMYWQFKYFQDITTVTPLGESLYDAAGSVCLNKLTALSRTYPQAVAGTVLSYEFNSRTAAFSLLYTPRAVVAVGEAVDGLTTEIYYNRDLLYPRGIKVVVMGGGGATVTIQCPTSSSLRSVLKLVQTVSAPLDAEDINVDVSITKCLVGDDGCTCK